MQSDSAYDRSFLLCELAAVLAVMASAPLAAAEPIPSEALTGQTSEREPITFEHVHGSKKLSIGGYPSTRITWLDDDRYLVRESTGWNLISAETGAPTEWYDKKTLSAALEKLDDVSAAEAQSMADGGWSESLNSKRIVVFKHKDMLIRITLDGTEPAVVRGMPESIELTTLSPTGSGVAFIHKDELWVADFLSGTARQLTHDAARHVRNGKADWVYFEEVYNRKWQAYRWSPDGKTLAYQQFNDTDVPTFQISDHAAVAQSFEVETYPKAGDKNPTVRLGVVSMQGGETQWIDTAKYPDDDFILSHFDWMPDSNRLYWYAQNRIQTWLDIVASSAVSGTSEVLLRDTTQAWVDNHGDLTFLSDGSFFFFSERSGWKHLYRASADGKNIAAVTFGEWEVRSLHCVSKDEAFIVVSGTKDSPIAENVYRVSLEDSKDDVVRLSKEDGYHAANVSTHGKYFVDSWSSLNQPTAVALRDSTGSEVRVLSQPATVPVEKYNFGKVELHDLPMADQSTTSAVFVYPPGFDPTKKYPVWLKTYAGPHAPGVKNSWNARLPDHLLANLGIVVITFDPRSASGYGAKSAWLAYRQLGVEETKDLLAVCNWLEEQKWADMSRIGLSGHSYGGYFTSYAMTHCDKICAGIAGAPVTDWANYDTIYTERFMSTPQENPDGYKASSVVAAASRLHGRLLLLHGLKDDNVHPENSIQLVHALQKANKQFDLMLYPTSRHGIFGDHYNKLVFNFMVEAMGKPEARQP